MPRHGKVTPGGDATRYPTPNANGTQAIAAAGPAMPMTLAAASAPAATVMAISARLPDGPVIDRAIWVSNVLRSVSHWRELALCHSMRCDVAGLRHAPAIVQPVVRPCLGCLATGPGRNLAAYIVEPNPPIDLWGTPESSLLNPLLLSRLAALPLTMPPFPLERLQADEQRMPAHC